MTESSPAGFRGFPRGRAKGYARRAHRFAAEGGKSDQAKPFKAVEGGMFEIALRYRGDAFRMLYAIKIGTEIWVIHAFRKKSMTGIKTPQAEVDLIRERLKRLKEAIK
ncbi:MAG: type II toxin-antitoxin system RelE/ParE family toxin [Methylococcales bacterium]